MPYTREQWEQNKLDEYLEGEEENEEEEERIRYLDFLDRREDERGY